MARLFDDGSNQYLEVASAPATATPLTIACWAYCDDFTPIQSFFALADSGSYNNYIALGLGGPAPRNDLCLYRRDAAVSDTTRITDTAVSINIWFHACGVLTAVDDAAVFLNGTDKLTDSTSVTPTDIDTTSIARIGDSSPGEYWSGRIAEPAIWNVALTDAEVGMLALGISPLLVRPASLVAYWPEIRTDRDRVGGYDMTAYNSPTWADHPPAIRSPWLKRRGVYVPAAAAGISIPVVMHHLRQQGVA